MRFGLVLFNQLQIKKVSIISVNQSGGRLVCGNTESSDKYRRDKDYKDVAYFVPYKKNGIDLAWSKAVTIYARYFSKTEQESIDFYNKLVQEHIDWLTKEAESLKSLLI